MIRRAIRFIGFLLLAAALVVTVIDAARWIGTDVYAPLPLATVMRETVGGRWIESMRASLPLVHDWIVQPFLLLPAFAIIFLLGTVLLWIGMPRQITIGFDPRP